VHPQAGFVVAFFNGLRCCEVCIQSCSDLFESCLVRLSLLFPESEYTSVAVRLSPIGRSRGSKGTVSIAIAFMLYSLRRSASSLTVRSSLSCNGRTSVRPFRCPGTPIPLFIPSGARDLLLSFLPFPTAGFYRSGGRGTVICRYHAGCT